jgi:hypothetical protein
MADVAPGRLRAARVVIVGCGRIAGGYNDADESAVLTHAVAYRRLETALVACCDRDRARADRFAARWGVADSDTDLAALMARTRPEVVSLCTPADARAEPLRIILAAPSVRAVLLEKPLATGDAAAQEVLRLCREAERPVLVNFPRAFDPFYQGLERQVAAWGPLRQGVARYYGSAVTNASHWLERALACFGSPQAVRRLGGSAVEPVFALDYPTGPLLFLPSPGCRYAPFELELLFAGHRLRVIDSERRAELHAATPDPAFPDCFNLTPAAHDLGVPSHEALFFSVGATLALARGGAAAVAWQPLLERAALAARILEEVGACP